MTYSSNLFYGASAKTLQNAKELRKSMTPAERKLWTVLQNRQLDDYKFHRLPHPNSRYASLSGRVTLHMERAFDPASIMVFTSKSVSNYID